MAAHEMLQNTYQSKIGLLRKKKGEKQNNWCGHTYVISLEIRDD